MRKSFFLNFGLCFLIILVCFFGLVMQVAAQAPPAVLSAARPQWEYLVIAFGGPAGGPIITTEKDTAPAKVGYRQVYYGDKLVRFTDNASSQAALDELGKAGWELVSVLAQTEDRPVSYIFKRQFERVRSQKESAEVARLEQEAKAGKKTVIRKEPLVDLDRAEVVAADDAVASRAKAKLEEAIKSAGLSSLVSVRTRYDSYSRETWAEVTVDGSGILLKDGNKFRTSEAKKYVGDIAAELFKKSGLQQVPGTDKYYFENGNVDKRGEIVINLAVFIKYNGRDNYVGRGAITGNWMAANQQKE